ncbi:iron-containing alcohol dehydrogenase [Macrolepiota fuliginosa MF-IS2]|uniref:Iron-containing alcohol dehydrogenase n=1 Tax=Macrolepiota fuliginosa MF-IS2 TaxID=1400762 RepID=A0A9P5XLJ7_9AGAR|nr:iron-containing alcohol dehydrogenase [Macrolepiota fuliginosa MF-IS2]
MSIIDRDNHASTAYHGQYSWQHNLQGLFYGPGCIKTALPELLDTLGIKKAMVLTSKSVLFKTDAAKKVEEVLRENNAYGTTFYEIQQHSPVAGIKGAIKIFEENGCDGIVSVGGGSCVDAAKTLLYFYQQDKGGRTPYQIAIPTTLSAAEYQLGAGYTNEEGHKVAVSSPELVPGGIILDAELTLGTPERLLSTGIKSMDHAVENLYRGQVTPPIKVLGYHAISELFKYLPLSKANPSSVEIRQKLQLASWMSLWPMKLKKYVALGISHSLGHKLGSRYNIPHGITSCMTLASSVALQAQIATQENKEFVAAALKYIDEPSTGTIEGDILKLSSRIDQLVQDLGLHSSLSEYKVPREDIPGIATKALGGADHEDYDKVLKMLEDMY